MKKLLLLTLISIGALTACDESPRGYHHHDTARVHAYRTHKDDGSFLYWYLLYTSNGTSYYYSSDTQVTNFTSANFTRVTGALPANVREQVQQAEDEGEQQLDQAQEPADVVQDQTALDAAQDAMTNEGGPDNSTSSSESSTSSSDSSSSDSSSSSE